MSQTVKKSNIVISKNKGHGHLNDLLALPFCCRLLVLIDLKLESVTLTDALLKLPPVIIKTVLFYFNV